MPRAGMTLTSRDPGKASWTPTTLTVRHWHRLLAVIVTVLALATVSTPGVNAQVSTPTSSLDAPLPSECTVAPRSAGELRALFQEAAATPIPDSLEASPAPAVALTGEPADARTAADVTATWRHYLACISAGDQPRMFALLSDAMVRRQFLVDRAFGVTEDALFDYLAATPIPIMPEHPVPFVPFSEVLMLSDGRVAAIGPGEQGKGDVRIFVRAGDRWLIDDWFDLS